MKDSGHRLRRALAQAHRYSGLAALAMLVCAGLTGSILVWNDELERWFAPQLFVMPQHPAAAGVMSPFDLRDRVASRFPEAQINGMPLNLRADTVADFQLEYPPDGEPRDDHVFLDSVTGRILGTRRDGDLREGAKNIMPFVDSLHEELALGDVGRSILGIASLLWALQCFSGLYLSLPMRRAAAPPVRRSWWVRWRPSWRVRTYADFKRIAFDVHRAGSLWMWFVLLVFAWSAMSFNLASVYDPIMGVLGYGSSLDRIADATQRERVPQREGAPHLDWRSAHAAGVRALSQAAAAEHFSVVSERLMMYRPDKRLYEYRVATSKDVEARGNTRVFLDADTGRVLGIDVPTGNTIGNSLTAWIEALHEGMVFGSMYRILVSLFGVMVAVVSIAGGITWLEKTSRRLTPPLSGEWRRADPRPPA